MVSVVCYVCGTYVLISVIGLSVLDIWSVLFVMYVGRMFYIPSDWNTQCTGHMVSVVCYVCGTCVLITSDSTERTGHVVSVVCNVCGTYVLHIVIGLSVLDMWSVLFVMYVGCVL